MADAHEVRMIASMLFLAAALADAPAPDQTSLFFECKMSAPGETQSHELGFVYFEPRISHASPLNFKDPDHLLPSVASINPVPVNLWPAAMIVAFPKGQSESGRPAASIIFEEIAGEAGTASARIGSLRDGKWEADSYAGTCTYTEGAAAEQKFRALLKQ
jgi:hypothetical protein